MTDFTVTITDPDQLAGITWAREAYNAALPPETPAMDGQPAVQAATIDTDEAYVQFVMEQAAVSYADQQLREQHRQAYEDDVTAKKKSASA